MGTKTYTIAFLNLLNLDLHQVSYKLWSPVLTQYYGSTLHTSYIRKEKFHPATTTTLLHMSVINILIFSSLLVVTKPHKIYHSINLTPWKNQFIQYGLYVIEKFVLSHGYEKILQTLNNNLVLLPVCHYAFPLANIFFGRRQICFPFQLSAPPCASIP